ncbi:hypothetical protein [Hymenobacter elongatus]|uniref:hypothetical protein n=1 Tax=Hymenobacter elongatus TaxID=877208 RepID=UPI00143674B1|nr:hypothetical protein [Hymenobacter elongatus]
MTGIFKDALVSLLATLAKQEKVRQGERVKAGLVRTVAKGTSSGLRLSIPKWLSR